MGYFSKNTLPTDSVRQGKEQQIIAADFFTRNQQNWFEEEVKCIICLLLQQAFYLYHACEGLEGGKLHT